MALPEILQQLKHLDRSSPQFTDQLTSLLYAKEFKDSIRKLQDGDVVWLVEYLDDVLDTLDSAGPAFRKSLRELGRMCGTRERLPQSYILESSLSILNKHPVASGGSGDIYQGSLKDLSVCVKRLRIYAGEETRGAKKTFYREAVMWKRLAHPNIVPLLGITLEPLQLISTWMPGGELKEYITHHLDTDRLSLLSGIADGLNYLHSRNIVHGDLKGPNILVDDSGCPRITDFGLAMVAQNQDSIRSAEGEHGHTARWTAPEILNEQGTYSKEADVFSFAMVMVEAFTGQVPFHPNLPSAAMLAILDQKRPARPTHSSLTDELWALMKCCWNQEPHDRPEMSVVLKTLRGYDHSFSGDRASIVSSAHTLLESTDSETVNYSESPKLHPSSKEQERDSGTQASYLASQSESGGKDEGGTIQIHDISQVATDSPTQSGNNPHHNEGQGGKLSMPIRQSQSRRGTDQSELQTPLPLDPAQIDPNQLHNSVHSPDNDSKGDTAGMHQPGLQGGNPSRTHLPGNYPRNNLGNSSQSRLDLQDSGRNTSQPSLGTTSDGKPTKNPSGKRPPGVNTGFMAPPHEPRTGTKPHGEGVEGLRGMPDMDTLRSPKDHGIWYRLIGMLSCVSDKSMHS